MRRSDLSRFSKLASVVDRRPHVACEGGDLVAVLLGRTTAETQVQRAAAEGVRVAQGVGDLVGRAVVGQSAISFEHNLFLGDGRMMRSIALSSALKDRPLTEPQH